jgi:hypothetical protein
MVKRFLLGTLLTHDSQRVTSGVLIGMCVLQLSDFQWADDDGLLNIHPDSAGRYQDGLLGRATYIGLSRCGLPENARHVLVMPRPGGLFIWALHKPRLVPGWNQSTLATEIIF